ncbi:MAG TPA: type II secretion system major pseudopilin GspG [Candidatus Binatia bacterium]|nr:type II secretion system major pseudopilin GspG [Candidatus Binatia bacterium]
MTEDRARDEQQCLCEARRSRERQSGFTMIELLVVMVILGMLAALVAPNFFQNVGKARAKTARVQIANLSTALDAMALDTGSYPNSQQGLDALLDAPNGMDMWDGPYIKKLPRDPWGNEYVYRGPDGGRGDYEIMSYGADGSPGGDGDAADVSNMD